MALKTNNIFFFKETVSFRLTSKEKIKLWLTNQVRKEGRQIANINFVFCSDPYLKRMNRQYLHHDYFTDIITFDNSIGKNPPLDGDVFISVDMVKKNAEKFGTSFNEELHRVIAHGVLHLLGYNDKTKKQFDEMKRMEEKWLAVISF